MRRNLLCVIGIGFWALAGCDSGGERTIAPEPAAAPEAAGAVEAPPEAPADAPEEAVGPSALGDGYELHAQTVGPYASGEAGTFALKIEAKDEWHLNEDYPTRVDISGPDALAFPKPALEKADAAEFGELAARFDVPFSAANAGEHAVEAKVQFAICTEQTCIPTERTVALMLPVE